MQKEGQLTYLLNLPITTPTILLRVSDSFLELDGARIKELQNEMKMRLELCATGIDVPTASDWFVLTVLANSDIRDVNEVKEEDDD